VFAASSDEHRASSFAQHPFHEHRTNVCSSSFAMWSVAWPDVVIRTFLYNARLPSPGMPVESLKTIGLDWLAVSWPSLEAAEYACTLRSFYIVSLVREVSDILGPKNGRSTHPFWEHCPSDVNVKLDMVEVQKKLKDPFFVVRLSLFRLPLDHRECLVPSRCHCVVVVVA
jgi:hypothetical protein